MPMPCLTANWENVILVNYKVDPQTIQRFVPAGTELDIGVRKIFISLVDLNFFHNKFLGLHQSIP